MAGRFKKALAIFENLAERFPADRPCSLYVERCAHLLANPPESWDGVWRLTSK